jgi:hypothetical protein
MLGARAPLDRRVGGPLDRRVGGPLDRRVGGPLLSSRSALAACGCVCTGVSSGHVARPPRPMHQRRSRPGLQSDGLPAGLVTVIAGPRPGSCAASMQHCRHLLHESALCCTNRPCAARIGPVLHESALCCTNRPCAARIGPVLCAVRLTVASPSQGSAKGRRVTRDAALNHTLVQQLSVAQKPLCPQQPAMDRK